MNAIENSIINDLDANDDMVAASWDEYDDMESLLGDVADFDDNGDDFDDFDDSDLFGDDN